MSMASISSAMCPTISHTLAAMPTSLASRSKKPNVACSFKYSPLPTRGFTAVKVQERRRQLTGRAYPHSTRTCLKAGAARASTSETSEPAPPPSGREGALRTVSTAYGTFCALAVVLFLVKLAAPQLYLTTFYRVAAPTPTQLSAVRVSGFGLLPHIASLFSLKEAATHDRMRSGTYGRLNVGIAVFAFGYLIYSLVGSAMNHLTLWGSMFSGVVAFGELNLAIHGHLSGTRTSPFTYAQEFVAGFLESVKPRGGTLSKLYTALAAALFAWGVGLLAMPQTLSVAAFLHQGGLAPVGGLVWMTHGACLLTSALTCLILKDASERGRLGASTFRNLNVGLAAMSLGTLGVMVSDLIQAVMAGCACCRTGLWQGVTSYWALPALLMLATLLTSGYSVVTHKA